MTQRRRGKRTILACGKTSRIPKHLSNYMDTGKGCDHDARAFRVLLIGQRFNGKKMVDALNNHPNTVHRFSLYKQTENQIQILVTDWLGNEDLIYITETPYNNTEV